MQLKTPKISEAVVRRLPVYLRYLEQLKERSIRTVSSLELGNQLDMNPAQIRKDLAYFGEFGRKGIGYEVLYLVDKIKQILKLDHELSVVLVGTGHLGIALSNYNNYKRDKLTIVALFDADPNKVNTEIGTLRIQPLHELKETVSRLQIKMGIITVPAHSAQEVADALVEAGIKAILNFAPIKLRVPPKVIVRTSDLTMELQALAYYMDPES